LVQLNNRLRELESDEQAEIWKILNQLSDDIRPMADEILQTSYELVGLDVIHAKAKLAILMNATKPKIIDHGLDIKDGRHPLLLLKNTMLRKETVPFSLYLTEANRILLISGPNAGGKSITLKALGLLQLMFQNGYLTARSQEFSNECV
jgi:DNA mismatch repair protein MutS2